MHEYEHDCTGSTSVELPEEPVTAPETVKTSAGVEVRVEVEDWSTFYNEGMESEAVKEFGEGTTVLSTIRAYLYDLESGEEYELAKDETVTIPYQVPGANTGENIVAFSLGAMMNSGEWKGLDTRNVKDGAVSVTYYSSSFSAIFVKLPADVKVPVEKPDIPKKAYVEVTLPETKGKTSSGAEVEISVDDLSKTDLANVAEKEALVKYGESANVLGIVDVNLWAVDGSGYKLAGGETMTVTFNVPGVKASDKIVALHMYDEENGKWEALETKVSDGTVTATFSSFSPVAYVKLPATTPKTGDAGVGGVLAVMAVC